MLQVKAEGVNRQAIGGDMIEISFTIDAFFGRSIQIHGQFVKREALHHAQVVTNRIILTRPGFQANARKQGFQLFLINRFRSPLLSGTGSKRIDLLKNRFYITPTFEVHVKVTGTHVSLSGIHRSRETHKEILGLEIAFRRTDLGIGHRGIDHVFLLQVAHERHFELMRSQERCIHELHHLPIKFRYLHGKVSRHIVGFQLGIEAGIDFHGRVPGFKCRIKLMIFERCGQVIPCQPIVGIMHLVHGSLHAEISFRSKEVQSFPVSMKIHRDIEKRVFR